MSYRYIALTDNLVSDTGCPYTVPLKKLEMELQGQVGRLLLFATQQTPILHLPGGSILIGDLYDHDGRPLKALPALQHLWTQRILRQHLLDHYWGEYILIQPPDQESDSTTLMRDPSGGISCAYSLHDSSGFITSDLSIASRLNLHRDQIDWEFVSHCLVYPHMKISRTGLTHIRELLPGCVLSFNDKKTATQIAWSPWNFVSPDERQSDPAIATKLVREATTSVIRAMAETDRTVLLELSGGMDSSIVGVCLAETRSRIACCTAITPLPGADERRYAEQIADYLGIELLQLQLDFEEAGIEFPLPEHSLRPAAWALSRIAAQAMDNAAASQGVSSHFSGSGGDTIFCYLTSAAPAADAFRERGLATGFQSIINLSKMHGCTVTKAARLTLRKLYLPPKPPYKPDYSLLTRINKTPPLELHPWFNTPGSVFPGDRERIFDLAGNQLFSDATLRSGGRRIRMPLLSQPVMEACLRVPTWMWISGGINRAIARSAFANQLPQDVLNRRSKGTFMSYTSAVYHRNKETIRSFLLDGCLQTQGLLDPDKLNKFLDSQLPARDRSFMRIFHLCMIENWVRNHA